MRVFFVALFIMSCLAASSCDGREDQARNIALHKPYSMAPAPSYVLCTEPGDAKQLTDGVRAGAIWTKTSTVGWHKPTDVIRIDIDLQGLFQIDTIRAYTVTGGHPDVKDPRYMAVLTSQDGREYGFARVVPGGGISSPSKSAKHPVTLEANQLDISARYLRLVFRPNVRYAFLDEIEILGHEINGNKAVHKALLSPEESPPALLRGLEEMLEIKEALGSFRQRLSVHGQVSASHLPIKSRVDSLGREVDAIRQVDLHQGIQRIQDQIGLLRAEFYRTQFEEPVVCLSANPMAFLKRSDMPSEIPCNAIEFSLWKGEHQPAAVNLVNTSTEPLEVTASIASLQNEAGRTYDSAQTFEIKKSVYTFVNTLGFIGDALIRQDNRPFTVKPGQIEQVWIAAFNPLLSAGNYQGELSIVARNGEGGIVFDRAIPLRMRVWPLEMPLTPSSECFNWAYYRCGSEEETALDLQLHGTTVAFLAASDLPLPPQNNKLLQMPSASDFKKIDRAIARHSYARQFMLFLNFREQQKDFGRFGQWMTPQWKTNFTAWLKRLVRHMHEEGLGYDRWLLHPFDETLCDEFHELALLIRKTDPRVRIFADHINDKPATILKFRDLVDVWCPNERHIDMYPDRLRLVQSFGRPVWMYKSQGPGRANDPYSYYRLAHWRAFQYGLDGVGFWVYHDKTGPADWDEIGSIQGHYGVIYSGSSYPGGSLEESIATSRRWEAWRKGVQDAEYLRRFDEASKKRSPSDLRRSNVSEIRKQIEHVIQNPHLLNNACEAKQKISEYLSE